MLEILRSRAAPDRLWCHSTTPCAPSWCVVELWSTTCGKVPFLSYTLSTAPFLARWQQESVILFRTASGAAVPSSWHRGGASLIYGEQLAQDVSLFSSTKLTRLSVWLQAHTVRRCAGWICLARGSVESGLPSRTDCFFQHCSSAQEGEGNQNDIRGNTSVSASQIIQCFFCLIHVLIQFFVIQDLQLVLLLLVYIEY